MLRGEVRRGLRACPCHGLSLQVALWLLGQHFAEGAMERGHLTCKTVIRPLEETLGFKPRGRKGHPLS